MSQPRNARSNNVSKGRTYAVPAGPNRPEEVPSVTTILSQGIPKPALVAWGPKMVAEFVVDNMDLDAATLRAKNGREAAVQLLKGSPYRERDAAADIGTLIHEIAEAAANNLPRPAHQEKHEGFVQALDAFLDEWQPKFLHTEMTVYNLRYGYAGTLDAIVEVNGARLLLDWKTTKPGRQGHGIYPEVALQLAAYRFAEFAVAPNGVEFVMPEVDDCVAVNLRPDGYRVVPVEADQRALRSFLYAQQVARFQEQGADLVGEPMAPPVRTAGAA